MPTLIRRPEVKKKTGFSDATIDRKELKGEFPRRVQLSDRAVAWVEEEIDQWINERVRGFGPTLPHHRGRPRRAFLSATPARGDGLGLGGDLAE
jgi:prophage regulatory protein